MLAEGSGAKEKLEAGGRRGIRQVYVRGDQVHGLWGVGAEQNDRYL